jgi:holo-[acyl-carrier protein] synthase
MTISVGIDLTCVDDVRDSIAAFGARYLERLYTGAELRDCGHDPQRLAGRFAAKEATLKALAVDEPVPWRSIAVRQEPGGGAALELSGAAARVAARRGIDRLTVSITHERDMAAAVVLAEGI